MHINVDFYRFWYILKTVFRFKILGWIINTIALKLYM